MADAACFTNKPFRVHGGAVTEIVLQSCGPSESAPSAAQPYLSVPIIAPAVGGAGLPAAAPRRDLTGRRTRSTE